MRGRGCCEMSAAAGGEGLRGQRSELERRDRDRGFQPLHVLDKADGFVPTTSFGSGWYCAAGYKAQ